MSTIAERVDLGQSTARVEVLDALQRVYPAGLTRPEVEKETGLDGVTVGRVLHILREDDVIHRSGFREANIIYVAGKASIQSAREDSHEVTTKREVCSRNRELTSTAGRGTEPAGTPPPLLEAAETATGLAFAGDGIKEHKKMTVVEKVTKALRDQGPASSTQLTGRTGLEATVVNRALWHMKRDKLAKRTGERGSFVFYLPDQSLSLAEAVRLKLLGATKAPAQPAAPATPARTQPVLPEQGDAAFGVGDDGSLGIEKNGDKLRLGPDEFTRLRTFIDKTEALWRPQ